MLEFVGEVAVDLAGMFINPDAEPFHPVARAVALVAACAVIALGLASIYALEGVIGFCATSGAPCGRGSAGLRPRGTARG